MCTLTSSRDGRNINDVDSVDTTEKQLVFSVNSLLPVEKKIIFFLRKNFVKNLLTF